jgi:hypothetical protein
MTPVPHRHKIADVRNVHKVVSNVAHSVHDDFNLVLDDSNRRLEGWPFGALDKIRAWVYLLIVVYKRNLAFLAQVRWRLRSSHTVSVSTVPCLLKNRHSKTQAWELPTDPPPFQKK